MNGLPSGVGKPQRRTLGTTSCLQTTSVCGALLFPLGVYSRHCIPRCLILLQNALWIGRLGLKGPW
jgi:hypothetical protein